MTAAGPRATFDRRQLLRTGGLTLSLGAIIAACGEDRAGGTDPGRVGERPDGRRHSPKATSTTSCCSAPRSPSSTRALDAYAAARGLDVLSAEQDTIVQRFVDDHTGHSVALGGFITEAGGEEFACANPWVTRRVITPIFDALDGQRRPVARRAQHRPRRSSRSPPPSYQALVGSLTEPDLRMKIMQIGADENRHAATLAMAITGTPDGYVNPVLLGEAAPAEEPEFPVVYAMPSTFGTVSAIELVVGGAERRGSAVHDQPPDPGRQHVRLQRPELLIRARVADPAVALIRAMVSRPGGRGTAAETPTVSRKVGTPPGRVLARARSG